jgi:hypothetical protein
MFTAANNLVWSLRCTTNTAMMGPNRDRQHRIAESITATGNALSSVLEDR